jgi:nucleotide-binding universal stress UspA family protein
MAALKTANPVTSYKVLVTIDFTEDSRRAVEYVLATLADRITHLYLLHSYREKGADTSPMASLNDILQERSLRLMQTELDHFEANPDFRHIQFVSVHRLEGLQEAICEVATAENVDLVAISNHNYRPSRLTSPEDDPNYLLHKLSRPLLLVPKLLN